MLVPVGIAYAEASGVPGIYGLYATIVPLLVYAVFGPSRILVLGPDSALAAVILAVVLPRAAGDPQRAVVLASAMAIVSGVACVAGGVRQARLRDRAPLETDPLRLHERHRDHRALESTPQALGLLRTGGGSAAADRGHRERCARRKDQRCGAHRRCKHARVDSAPAT